MTTNKDESQIPESDPNQDLNTEKSNTPNQTKKPTPNEQPTPKKKIPSTIRNISKQTTHQLLLVKIIGILFFIVGLFMISQTIPGTQKLGIILTLVGIIFIFFISIKHPEIHGNDLFVALALSICVIASYFITFQMKSDVFFSVILVGFLIIIEFSQEYISKTFQKRLNIMLFFLLMVFFLIIAEKIVTILHS